MRDDHPPRQPADPDLRRGAGQQQAPLRRRRLGPDQERQATQVHPPERNITRLIGKNLHTSVAGSGQVYWLIARHASDRRENGRADPSRFSAPWAIMQRASSAPTDSPATTAGSASSPKTGRNRPERSGIMARLSQSGWGSVPDDRTGRCRGDLPRHADCRTPIPARNSMMLSRSQSPRITAGVCAPAVKDFATSGTVRRTLLRTRSRGHRPS
jgi:hypothetical protein